MNERGTLSSIEQDTIRPEYYLDYSKAVRGKFVKRLQEEHSNLIVLDPDVANVFKDSQSVNHALRTMISISHFLQNLESPSYSAMEKH